MKKRLLSILILSLVVVLVTAGLVACIGGDGGAKYLNPPVVTLNGNVASWVADTNAVSYEISLNGSLSKVANTVTTRTLVEGVPFKVRAVGDGEKYLTSDWSNTVTYYASQVQGAKDISFAMINDTHGAFTDSQEGYSIGRVDSLMQSLEKNGEDYVFIHNGDAFQGSFVSGETYGLAMVEALNEMDLDCFVLGNHEFDWGIDKIEAYADGNPSNGEANFPFLGANIFLKGTTTRPDWVDAYTIVEREGVKIGIIGIMGDDQESSILTRYVKDYDFVYPMNIISENATYLRNTENCDVVVVATHDYNESMNEKMASLSGDSRIDAIFSAHTHQNKEEFESRKDGKSIPVVQCYHKNNNLSEVVLKLDGNNQYLSATIEKHYPSDYNISSRVQTVINKYQSYIDEANEVLGTAPYSLSKSTLGGYAVSNMLSNEYEGYNFGDIDVAIINTGGVRAEIDRGDITKAEVFEVFPFNNAVVLVNMRGSLLKSLCEENDSYLYIGGNYSSLSDNTIYQLAVLDYVFEGTRYYQFSGLSSSDYIQTDILLRDILIEYLDEAFDSDDDEPTPPSQTLETLTIAQFNTNFTSLVSSGATVKVSGITYAQDQYGMYIQDGASNLYVYTQTMPEVTMGQRVTATGVAGQYATVPQLQATTFSYESTTGSYTIPTTITPISQIIAENDVSATIIYDHKVYRTSGVLTQAGSFYNLVDGADAIQFKKVNVQEEYDYLISYLNKEIVVNIVVADVHDGISMVRVITLTENLNLEEVGSEPEIPDTPATPKVTIAQFIADFNTYKTTDVTLTGMAYSCDNGGIYIDDGTANVYISTAYQNLYVGQEVTVTGKASVYYSSPRIVPSSNVTFGEISSYTAPVSLTSIADIVEENTSQSEMVFDHNVYRTSGVVRYLGGQYCLVDGENRLQLAGTVAPENKDEIVACVNKKIEINIVIHDYFLTTSVFRFVPLRMLQDIVILEDNVAEEDGNLEPERINTTIEDLLANKPTGHKTVIYVVTATWVLKPNNSSALTYGNGWLKDENDNQVEVYGLCADGSVAVWNGTAYDYSNNRSYGSSGIQDGDLIVVGMLYDTSYDNYNCFIIEIVGEDTPEESDNTVLNFIQINDTHGAFADSKEGSSIGRVDTLVTTLESQKGNYIFIHGGDAFQGSYASGETHGLVLIEALNQMSLDCFVIGNHEFDWGLDVISAYKDGNTLNGEANFPFLGANIFYQNTTTRPDWIDAYTIVETGGVKVGIIGIMGFGQESSILTRHVKDYYFAEPLPIVSSTANYLRTTEECDVVVVATHDYDYDFNVSVGNLSGDSRIDGIFTAHTHQDVKEYVTRSDGKQISVIQSLHKNNQASTISMTLDSDYNYLSSTYGSYTPGSYSISSRIQTIITKYQYLLDEGEEVIGNTESYLNKPTLGGYVTEAMIDYSYTQNTFGDVDISILNTGGVRATIDNGDITRAEVFEVFPFDNIVVIVNMKGSSIKSLVADNEGYVYVDASDALESSGQEIEDNTLYQVAVVDYVYENKYYTDYFNGYEYVVTDVLMRDIFMTFVEESM